MPCGSRDFLPFFLSLFLQKRSATDSSLLGFVRNVQTQIEYEKATKLNEAVSVCHIPVLVIDLKGTVKRVNTAGLRTFGYTSAQLVGKNIKMLKPRPPYEV